MPRLSVGKRCRLVALLYQFDLKTSGKKYDRLVELASEEDIFINAASHENYEEVVSI
jgi:hypothetical protein